MGHGERGGVGRGLRGCQALLSGINLLEDGGGGRAAHVHDLDLGGARGFHPVFVQTELKDDVSQLDPVVGFELDLAADQDAVEQGSVAAAQVLKKIPANLASDLGVFARHGRVLEAHVGFQAAAEGALIAEFVDPTRIGSFADDQTRHSFIFPRYKDCRPLRS